MGLEYFKILSPKLSSGKAARLAVLFRADWTDVVGYMYPYHQSHQHWQQFVYLVVMGILGKSNI